MHIAMRCLSDQVHHRVDGLENTWASWHVQNGVHHRVDGLEINQLFRFVNV